MYNDLTTKKDFIPFKEEIVFNGYKAIGYFPYETARVRGIKVSRHLYSHVEQSTVHDNKTVVVFKDTTNFGTHDFAIFFHDLGAIIGGWGDVQDYNGLELK